VRAHNPWPWRFFCAAALAAFLGWGAGEHWSVTWVAHCVYDFWLYSLMTAIFRWRDRKRVRRKIAIYRAARDLERKVRADQ
jgi:hypothetical protein